MTPRQLARRKRNQRIASAARIVAQVRYPNDEQERKAFAAILTVFAVNQVDIETDRLYESSR